MREKGILHFRMESKRYFTPIIRLFDCFHESVMLFLVGQAQVKKKYEPKENGGEIYATLSSDEFKFAHKKSRDSLESLLS